MISSEQKKGENLNTLRIMQRLKYIREIKLTKGRSQYGRVKEKQRKEKQELKHKENLEGCHNFKQATIHLNMSNLIYWNRGKLDI